MTRKVPQRASPSSVVELTIEKLVEGGDGLGRVGNRVCFVPYAAPGDCLQVRIVHVGRRFSRGVIEKVKEPGPSRRGAPCSLYRECGGCNWMHIDESEQLRAKAHILSHALGVDAPKVAASPKSFGYRGRARLQFQISDEGEFRLGFIREGGQGISDVAECPVLEPRLNSCIAQLRKALGSMQGIAISGERSLRGEIALTNGKDKAAVYLCLDAPAPPSLYRALDALPESLFSGVMLSVDAVSTLLKGVSFAEIDAADNRPFIVPAASFGQANAGINHLLSETIRRWISERRYRKAAELFCGAANWTVTLAPFFERAVASELDPEACTAAKRNLSVRRFTHVSVLEGEALDIYRKLNKDIDLLVLNPPRTGHHDLARAVASNGHSAVLYVSCNPSTLARDIAELRRVGYDIKEIAGFDMFPQTSHMETAVLLECSNR